MSYSIEVTNLSKRFGKFIAVDDISFTVEKGRIVGFLGANGAGKSTTIKMLCAILNSTSGTAKVAGYDINTQPESVKKHIGYMSQKFSLYEDLTVEENIEFFGGIYGMSNTQLKQRRNWALEMAGLKGLENSIAKSLPGGWKQRLALGCAGLHEPEVIFLDEPTGGVDPVSRRSFWDLINDFSEKGATVFVTTHYLDEAEYCHEIMLIHNGKIVAGGSPVEMKKKYLKHDIFEITAENPIEVMSKLQKEDWITETSLFGNKLHLSIDSQYKEEFVMRNLRERGYNFDKIDKVVPSLEDVFIHLVENKN